jgi:hypothetical protein
MKLTESQRNALLFFDSKKDAGSVCQGGIVPTVRKLISLGLVQHICHDSKWAKLRPHSDVKITSEGEALAATLRRKEDPEP